MGIVHNKKYDINLDNNIHINHRNVKYYNLKENDNYVTIFNKIKNIMFLTNRTFIADANINDNTYIILGVDFILDNNNNPYLIEINAYPNLWYEDKLEFSIKNNMLNDFAELYIEPKINNTEPKQGDWILCNPLYDTTLAYKIMNLELQKNLYKHVKNYDYLKNNSMVMASNYFSKNIYKTNNSVNYLNKKAVNII